MQQGDFSAAERYCDRLVGLDPSRGEAWYLAAIGALETGRLQEALNRFETAVHHEPDRADIQAAFARCLLVIGHVDRAMACLDRAMLLPVQDALTADTIGNCLTRLGRHQEAVASFEDAVRLDPNRANIQWNFATALTFHGDFERAAQVYQRVLDLDPDHVGAWLGLADVQDGAPPEGRVEAIEGVRERVQASVDRNLVISHALAKTLEAADQPERAYEELVEARLRMKGSVGYTIDDDRVIFATIKELFPGPDESLPPAGEPGAGSGPAPIFVVGMPRTGTTLFDRMLSMHSAVASAGELSAFPECLHVLGQGKPGSLLDAAALRRAAVGDLSALGATYRELLPQGVAGAQRFIDKQPLNFLLIGFILKALPGARVICLRRGPMATCLASFRQLFALNFPHYRYALDPVDTAEYFALFDDLMRHWSVLYPGAIHELGYEQLVSEPEAAMRGALDYLGLDFEPAVLANEENESPVVTASSVQVRQPVHSDSVAMWQRYAKQLAPVRERLESLGIRTEAAS